jgi:hypothetical protein
MSKVHIYQEFDQYWKALDFKQRTLMLFDPMAYDTWLDVRAEGKHPQRKYIVHGHRYASAD